MKFKIIISKQANKFFFITNLTEWHFSCRKKYNEDWILQLKSLTKKEKDVLQKYKKILKKYNFNNYLGKYFINNYPNFIKFYLLKKQIETKEFQTIKEVFKILNKTFNEVWVNNNYKQTLKENKKILKKELNNKKFKKINKKISKLTLNNSIKKTNIYLFSHSSPKYFGGGANIGKNNITLETCSIKNNSYLKKILSLILHEIFHNYIDSSKNINAFLKKDININIKEKINKTSLLKELIICSFLPNGYIGQKYFNIINKKTEKENTKLSTCNLISKEMYNMSKEYFEKEIPLDEKFINTIKKRMN
jgi:hypothetical protein